MHNITFYEGGGVGARFEGDFRGGKRKVFKRKGTKMIGGMSGNAKTRLLRWLLENEGERSGGVWGVTLTIRDHGDAETWRENWRRVNCYCLREKLPLVWRVELQKRGTPHIHCIVWGTLNDCESLRFEWLRLWGVVGDRDHEASAVDIRAADGGWFGYVVLHQGKHSVQSASWEGRHWGVCYRKGFRGRECRNWRISDVQYDYIRRVLDRIYRMRGRRRRLPLVASWDAIGEDMLTVQRLFERSRVLREF
jgi:hypothetical protein